MSWSDIESLVSSACVESLTNVIASIELATGTVEIPVVFDREYIEANGMAGSGPLIRCQSSSVRGVKTGIKVHLDIDDVSSLDLKEQSYRIVEVRPDGKGITDMVLQEIG